MREEELYDESEDTWIESDLVEDCEEESTGMAVYTEENSMELTETEEVPNEPETQVNLFQFENEPFETLIDVSYFEPHKSGGAGESDGESDSEDNIEGAGPGEGGTGERPEDDFGDTLISSGESVRHTVKTKTRF